MIGFLAKYKIYLIVLVLGGLFFWHYTSLLEEVGTLKTSFKQEQQSHDATKNSFNAFVEETEANFARQREIINKRTEAFKRYEEDLNELQAIYSRHDLEKLLQAKPDLLERRINDGTERLFNAIRSVSAFEGQLNPGEDDTSKTQPNSPP